MEITRTSRRWRALGTLVLVCLMMPSFAGAQTGAGSIAGVVKDATGAVLPGVTVEASSPVLIEKVRSVVTNGEGQYKIIELRPGSYAVTFSLPSFNTVKRDGIELTTGFTATVNAELKVGDVAETITVSGQSPMVDLQNTKQEAVMTRDVIDSVPSGREVRNLAVLIPGMYAGGQTSSPIAQDVGGQSGQSHVTMTIHGGRQSDQQLQVDGMSMQTWTRVDASSVFFTDGNFQEYAIDVASNSADVETGGVRINLLPREGGNTFKGSFFANYTSDSLQNSNVTDALKARGLSDPNRVKTTWTVNPAVGGPVKKDKLWFFATYTPLRVDNYVAGAYVSKDPASWVYSPDLTRQAVDESWGRDVGLRLTWQATARNKVTFYYDYNDLCHCTFTTGRGTSPEASTYLIAHNRTYQVTWTSPVTSRLLFAAGASAAPQPQDFLAQPNVVAPRINDIGQGVNLRARNAVMLVQTTNWNYRGSMSYVTGSHAAKIGFTLLYGAYRTVMPSFLGNVNYTTVNGVPSQVTYLGNPIQSNNRIRPNLGIYGQDQWTLHQLTVNAGVRFDHFRSDYPDQNVPPTQFVPVPRVFSTSEAVNWNDLSPRLGVSYNLFGNGKTAIKASLNRFVLQEGTTRASTINPISSNNSDARRWTDNGDYVVQGDPFNQAANLELGPSTNLNFGKPVVSVHYDPAWATGFGVRPNQWEISAGMQHQLIPRVSVSGSYFRRTYRNFAVVDNRAVAPTDYSPYCVVTPVDSRLPGGGGQQLCGLFDLNPPQVGKSTPFWTSASKVGQQDERWNGLDLTVNARLPKLLLQGGVSSGKTMTDDCAIVSKFPEITVPVVPGGIATSGTGFSADFCRIETPFLTQAKLLGSYTLPGEIQVAATYQDLPGPQIIANAVFSSAQVAPFLGRALSSASSVSVNIVKPGTLYGERMRQVDLRLTKIIKVRRTRFQGMVDLYNALNANPVLVLNNTYGVTTGALAGASWQVPQGILPARVIKFGVQVSF